MEFFLIALMFLILLCLGAWCLVESGFLFSRCYRWAHSSLPSRLSSFWYARQVAALKSRYERERARRRPVSLGALRFTRTRAEQFGDGPPGGK
jgi:hypothetical protein